MRHLFVTMAAMAVCSSFSGPALAQAPTAVPATITVNYLPPGAVVAADTCYAWSAEARAAFDRAASLWAAKLQSSVPITIDACWTYMDAGMLGRAGSLGHSKKLTHPPYRYTYYPSALANAINGYDGNTANSEIYAAFNAAVPNWYFGTDGIVPGDRYDFVTAVMHELGHGLGFDDSFGLDPVSGLGAWGLDTTPDVYDRFVVNGAGQELVTDFPNFSLALGAELVGNDLQFEGPNTRAANADAPAALHAPAAWSLDSVRHLADSFRGTANALMARPPALGEAIHDPGPVALGMLQDMGWKLATPTPAVLYLDTGNSPTRIPPDSLSWVKVKRTGGLPGVAIADLAVSGGCTLSAPWVWFADGSDVALPSSVSVYSDGMAAGATCTVTLTAAAPAVAVSPRTFAVEIFQPDKAPDPFGFINLQGVVPEATVTSNAITPTGIDWQTTIAVGNGAYSIGCLENGFTTAPGLLFPGDKVCVRHVASPRFAETVTTTLDIGGVTGTFSSTTVAMTVVSLANGVAAGNLAGAAGSRAYFSIDVPPGATSLVIQTTAAGRGADLNLYVRRDAVPTTLARDCFSVAAGTTAERCAFTNPPPGRYFIMLVAATSYSGASLSATYVAPPPPSPGTLSLSTASASLVEGTGSASFSLARTGGTLGAAVGSLGVAGGCTLNAASVSFADGSSTPSPATVTISPGAAVAGGICTVTLSASGAALGSPGTLTITVTDAAPPPVGTPLANGATISGLSGASGSSGYYYIDVPSGASSLLVQTSGGTRGANANLYVRRDSVPTTVAYDCSSTGASSTESCSFASPAPGRYYILLHGASTFSGVNLQATYLVSAPSPGSLALNLSGTAASLRVATGSTSFTVSRSGGTSGAATANLAVTGGCVLSAPSVSFANGSSTPSPATVSVLVGGATAGSTCTVTLTATGAGTGSPSAHSIAVVAGRG